jgi:hypothetical protein
VIRILRRLAAAVSLLLCVGVLVLWARSYSGRDYAEWTKRWREGNVVEVRYADLLSREGRLRLSPGWATAQKGTELDDIFLKRARDTEGKAIFTARREQKAPTDYAEKRVWEPIEWDYYTGPVISGEREGVLRLYVDHWVMAVVFGIAPAVWGVRWWRRRRFPEGSCQNCGYDLRESPGRCPECGTENRIQNSEVRIQNVDESRGR